MSEKFVSELQGHGAGTEDADVLPRLGLWSTLSHRPQTAATEGAPGFAASCRVAPRTICRARFDVQSICSLMKGVGAVPKPLALRLAFALVCNVRLTLPPDR